jgi:hypothetical protein
MAQGQFFAGVLERPVKSLIAKMYQSCVSLLRRLFRQVWRDSLDWRVINQKALPSGKAF